MESFLYNAENRLREYRTKNPLLIFRNDGDASRVAKTIALKTYSSGPRGGMEGVKVFSKQYNLSNVLSMDVGGTTTDIGHVVRNEVNEDRQFFQFKIKLSKLAQRVWVLFQGLPVLAAVVRIPLLPM
jgi:N-methylhydantoinase A/oxoprolinase/acetone carboxylase beta subunit